MQVMHTHLVTCWWSPNLMVSWPGLEEIIIHANDIPFFKKPLTDFWVTVSTFTHPTQLIFISKPILLYLKPQTNPRLLMQSLVSNCHLSLVLSFSSSSFPSFFSSFSLFLIFFYYSHNMIILIMFICSECRFFF